MVFGRIAGCVFWALALVAAGAEFVRSLEHAAWMPLALGEAWFTIDRASLGLAQAGIQRHVHAMLWDPVIVTLLLGPLWLYGGILGTLLLLLFRRRQRQAGFRQ
ncbi:MAG: hypothetical protein QF893_22135 [Alphaproteobacteria bacterium]|jgi:hypothetical protein|nr:hypothetical protein [Alphaproteobacteria bacterium]